MAKAAGKWLMNWYPWLNQAYRQLVESHQQGRGHHALLVHANAGTGADVLIYGLSRWLMCQDRQGMKSCGKCHSCHLMMAETHPDWYIMSPEKGKTSVGVEAIRQITEKLYSRSQQGGVKIVWLPLTECLTDAAANALLKTLEEPPEHTYFLLECRQPASLLATLRSRCFYYFLPVPETESSLYWLQKQLPLISSADAITALKLSQGAPVAAEQLLQPGQWQIREQFCQAVKQALDKRDALSLLPQLNHENAPQRLHWLISLLLDAVKWQQQVQRYCINQDQQTLIYQLSSMHTMAVLLQSVDDWMSCRHQLLSVVGVNWELLLAEQLLNWEKQFTS